MEEQSGLWIFGYGSLCWHPGFEFQDSVLGFVRGFSRRFWQGNTTHRGTVDKPGRVATLVEDREGEVWGRAFQITGEAALPYLDTRECKLGGYITQFTMFFPRDSNVIPFPVLQYVATPANVLWLGEAPLTEIASQIVECSGPSGHNAEYLLRLADFMKTDIPEVIDEHLFTLEILVRTRIKERNMCLKTLMGEKESPRLQRRVEQEDQLEQEVEGAAGDDDVAPRPDSFQFTSRVPPKKLRCLNI